MGRGDVLRSFGTKRKWNESSSPHCNLHSPRFVQLGWKFRSRSPAAPRVVFQFRSPSLEKHRFVRWNAWTIEALEFPSFSCFSYSIGHDSISMYRFTRVKEFTRNEPFEQSSHFNWFVTIFVWLIESNHIIPPLNSIVKTLD